jgi:RimJ/RimL family protein N-acetyltransferase
MNQNPLDTERLLLRPFERADAGRTAELAGDEVISDTTIRIPHPYTETMAAEWIETHASIRENGLALFYAIELKVSGELVGSVGLDLDFVNGRADMGYWIGKEFWGSGYATEAASRLLRHAFMELKLHKVSAHHFARNPASGRVLEKIGMKREGLLKEHVRNSGRWEDIVQYGILESDFTTDPVLEGKRGIERL